MSVSIMFSAARIICKARRAGDSRRSGGGPRPSGVQAPCERYACWRAVQRGVRHDEETGIYSSAGLTPRGKSMIGLQGASTK